MSYILRNTEGMINMRNYKVFAKCVIAVIIITAIGFAGAAFAKTIEVYKILNPQSKVIVDKILTVSFDKQLKESTVNTQNVVVSDSINKNIAVKVSLDSSKKVILIEPVKKYDYGKTYTIYVKKTVKYATGKYLKNGIKMKFTTISKSDDNNLTLPAVGSFEKLKQLIKENNDNSSGIQTYIRGGVKNGSTISKTKTAEDTNFSSAVIENSGYSSTNVQVQGVDEGDIVKTDGQYIYKISKNKVIVIKILPDNKLQIADVIDYNGKNFIPNEIYIDSKYLTVIGTSNDEAKSDTDYAVPDQKSGVRSYYLIQRQVAKAVIYDISNREDLKQLREISIEGSLISSRKIGSKLYLVTNKYIDSYCALKGMKEALPAYKDSVSGTEFSTLGFDRIRYFPDSINLNYLITAGVDLDNFEKTADVSAYLGAGDTIFVSMNNMYVTISKFNYNPVPYSKVPAQPNSSSVSVKPSIIGRMPTGTDTLVYKFSLNNGQMSYAEKAQVPGKILSQFSMDENNGYFRIATTTGQSWWGSTDKSKNNLYILDSRMNVSGKIEGLAPGEEIYSSRFIGERGYIVTYKKVDPLFVIDLKDPENPKVVGYLKIPGYSQYLHPYDENHIIGIGKDSIEIPDKSGNQESSRAFYLGIKAAIFDITDVKNPKEMFVTKIGDRGTDSEALYDHKALLFSKDKNLLALPVNLSELKEGQAVINAESGYPEYGRFTFQGAYIYNIDLVNGFQLKGRITHYDNRIIDDNGYYPYDESNNINRIIYIGNALYTISDGMIKAIDMNNLQEKDKVILP